MTAYEPQHGRMKRPSGPPKKMLHRPLRTIDIGPSLGRSPLFFGFQVPAEMSPATICTDQQMDTPDGRKEARKFAKSAWAATYVWEGTWKAKWPIKVGRDIPSRPLITNTR